MSFEKKILQDYANQKGNLTEQDLFDYFSRFGRGSSAYSSQEAADECIELTKDMDDNVPMKNQEDFDPLVNPTRKDFMYSNLVDIGNKFGEERYNELFGEENLK